MAHKKAAGSSKNGRDSESNRLGVKLFGGQKAIAGNIIIRQRGTKYHPGEGVGMGKDHTIFAKTEGVVSFRRKKNNRTFVSVLPDGLEAAPIAVKPVKKAEAKVVEPKTPEVAEEDTNDAVEEAPKAEKKEVKKEKKKEEKKELSTEEKSERQNALLAKLGTVEEADKDDLKKISGVGPKLEGVLNSIGIYSFSQVAKMTKEEYDLLDSLTQSFPGRAERDDWAGQAKGFMEE